MRSALSLNISLFKPLVAQVAKPQLVFVLEMLLLHFQQLRLLAEKLLGFPSDSGILPGSDCCDGRSECFGAGWGLVSLYFRLLCLAPEDSAEQAFSHVDPPLTLRRCWRMPSALATNAPLGLPERRLWRR